MQNSTDQVDPTPCPSCGGPLEIAFGVWARGVVLAPTPQDVPDAESYPDGQVVDCFPSPVSDLPDGINVNDEWRVTCAGCGHHMEVHHGRIPVRWSYTDPTTLADAGRPAASAVQEIVDDARARIPALANHGAETVDLWDAVRADEQRADIERELADRVLSGELGPTPDAAAIDRALQPISEVLAWAREHHEHQGAELPGTWWVPEALEAARDAVAALRPADPKPEA